MSVDDRCDRGKRRLSLARAVGERIGVITDQPSRVTYRINRFVYCITFLDSEYMHAARASTLL